MFIFFPFEHSYTSLTLKYVNTEGKSPFWTKMEEKKMKIAATLS